jgi:hypothetical protein
MMRPAAFALARKTRFKAALDIVRLERRAKDHSGHRVAPY